MPPKKREKEVEASKSVVRIDHLQADHELFLQAFEKPTQIYRFLRTRNMLKPIYLNRTLSYMKQRMSRSHKSRNGFKVNSILDRVIEKTMNELSANTMRGYMTLTFLGFHDNNINANADSQVRVEALLLNLSHKKRKDSSAAGVEVSIGSCSVPLNPCSGSLPLMAPALSISAETFSPSHGPDVKSYVLLLRVSLFHPHAKNNQFKTDDSDMEPAHKKCKIDNYHRVLGCELVVYDKHNRCLLKSGEYDLVLKEFTPQVRSPHKGLPTHWETLSQDVAETKEENNPFNVFKLKPTLKLRLSWNKEATNGMVAHPKPLVNGDLGRAPGSTDDNKTETVSNNNSNHFNKENKPSNCSKLNNMLNQGSDTQLFKSENGTEKTENSNNLQIIYQFLYNNNSRQQTEACEDLHCPWCSLDCGRLYSLLKHLKLCHSRFNFMYHPLASGARIDVSINESYDGSYAGSPHWACMSGGVRGGSGPSRRTPLTEMLVCHPPRKNYQNCNLAEFRETEDNDMTLDGQRPYITGHNRLYHHTISCLPVNPKELEVDSEGETDPLWLQQKTMMMIDEFTDVNEGEKELMKMWNLHVMKYNFVGDCQIPLACQMFVQTRGRELLEKNLYRNFVLHMCSLHDFGLISPIVVYHTIQMLNQLIAENNDVKQKIRQSIILQREHWKAVGMHQQPSLDPKPVPQTKSLFSGFNCEASPSVRRKTSNIIYSQNPSTSSGNEAKKKAETSNSGNNHCNTTSADKESYKKSHSNGNNSNMKGPTSSILPQVVLRRKSVGCNQTQNVNSSNRKRLSLQDRKNST